MLFSVDNTVILLKRAVMALISYDPLWRTMEERGITKYTLIYKLGFSAYTITNLRKNKSITMNTLEKLCKALQCSPNDVIQFVDE